MHYAIDLHAQARATLSWARARFTSFHGLQSLLGALDRALGVVDPCRLPEPVRIPVRVPRPRPSARVILASLSGLLVLPIGASADRVSAQHNGSAYEFSADGRLVDMEVLVDGHAAPLYFAQGRFDRRYFQAFKGRNYSLAVRNNTGRRVGVLISVDGINVVNGERYHLSPHESMYVLDPHERAVIKGWRSSLNDVRRFVFVDEHRSYAERTGQANGDLGWIRVLAFREQRSWWNQGGGKVREREDGNQDDDELDSRREAAPEGEARGNGVDKSGQRVQRHSPEPQSNPGTGWGERRWDPVRRVWFTAEPNATDHLVLRYEYASGLRALGIFPNRTRDRLWERENGELGFAQPPRW